MQGLFEEIQEIPKKSQLCLEENQNLSLPKSVPYIGMGSSYYAPLTLYYAGADINPQIASEYYYYLSQPKRELGVLLSQSGESSETVWNLDSFEKVVSVVNYPNSSLAKAKNSSQLVEIHAGEENFSSTKTYVNTLISLYLGLGLDPKEAVEKIKDNFFDFDSEMKILAEKIAKYLQERHVKGLYIIGSGPNIGTAYEGALTLSETTKLSWMGMPVAQYDHGPKETASDTLVIAINSHGKDKKRIDSVRQVVQNNSNALFIEILETQIPEQFSSLTLIVKLNLLMNYLADELRVGNTFELGGKVTTVDEDTK